jgi:iron complex outermembrane receptor protein
VDGQQGAQARTDGGDLTALEEIVVEATKMGATVVGTPQSLSVLSSVDLDLRGVQDFTDAMRYVPGAAPEVYGFEGRGYEWLFIRGFDATYSGSYRDGLNQAQGWFAVPQTEAYNVESVEILRGPSSALFGQSDAGGIVNRVSKRPGAGARSEFIAEVGNFDRKKIGLDVGSALNDDETLHYRLVSTVLDTGTQRKYVTGERPDSTSHFIAPSLLWKISDTSSLTLLGDYRKGERKGYSFYTTSPDGTFNGVLVGDPDFVRYDDRQGSLGYRFQARLGEAWELRQNFRYSYVSAVVDDIYPNGFDGDGRTLYRYTIKSDDWVAQTLLDTHLQGDFRRGAVDHTVMVGVDVNRQHWDVNYFVGDAPTLDILNPVYGVPVEEASLLAWDLDSQTRMTGLYAQYRAQFASGLSLTVGSRFDKAKVITNDDSGGTRFVTEQDDEEVTMRAGVNYAFENGLVPYLSYSESFLAQPGADFFGTPHEPTRGEQIEAGVKYQPAGVRGLITVALFDINKTNVITADPDHYGYSFTKGEIESRGVELEGRLQLADGVDLSASATFLDVEIVESNYGDRGKVPLFIPERMANLWVDYSRFSGSLSGLTLSGGVRTVGKRFDDPLNEQSSDAYTLMDLGARYELGPWLYAFNAVNALNKQYYQNHAFGGYAPGYDRTLTASVRYHW